jgi:hypothetical protein
MTRLDLDIKNAAFAIEALLRQFPELAEDEELLADTIEGATDADAVMSRIALRIREEDAQVVAMKSLATLYTDRARDAENRKAALRRAALTLLTRTGLQSWKRPEGTFYLVPPRASVDVHTPEDVPTQLCKVEVKPDRRAIQAALENGEQVPGCVLSRGTASLGLR